MQQAQTRANHNISFTVKSRLETLPKPSPGTAPVQAKNSKFSHNTRAEIFDDSTMLVYGGFSHRCEDYCDDMWRFNFKVLPNNNNNMFQN